MNDEIVKILKHFNLSEKEAGIYLASLQIGKGTVYEIAKVANIKRPTAYVLIDGLIQKGLIVAQKEKNKTVCLPISPRRLVETWRGRLEALEAISPELNAYYQKGQVQPTVLVFEGEKGIDAVYSELTPKDTKGEEILVFGSLAAVKEKFAYRLPVWSKVVKNKRNKIRELVNKEEGVVDYAKQMAGLENPNYQVRVTKNDVFGKGDTIIYRNKIAIFSLKKELFVIVIESAEIEKTYKALFESAWADSELVK